MPPSEAGNGRQVPKTLDAVMEDALAKDPAIRTGSIGELADRVGAAYRSAPRSRGRERADRERLADQAQEQPAQRRDREHDERDDVDRGLTAAHSTTTRPLHCAAMLATRS